MIRDFLNRHKNINTILVSIAIVVWFYSVTGIVEIITNCSKKLETYLGLIVFSMIILYLDDYKLTELHKGDSNDAAMAVTTRAHM